MVFTSYALMDLNLFSLEHLEGKQKQYGSAEERTKYQEVVGTDSARDRL